MPKETPTPHIRPEFAARDMRHRASEEMSQLLQAAPWDHFLTLTSENRSHPEIFERLAVRIKNRVNQWVYQSKNWQRFTDGIEYVVAIERHKTGYPHSHMLVRFPDHDARDINQVPLKSFRKVLDLVKLGHYKLELINSQVKASNYVCKYMTKDGHLDWNYDLNAPRVYNQTLLAPSTQSIH